MTKTEWTLEEALAVKGTSHTTDAQLWAHVARLRKRNGDTAGAARATLAASTAKFCVTLSARRAREERAAELRPVGDRPFVVSGYLKAKVLAHAQGYIAAAGRA